MAANMNDILSPSLGTELKICVTAELLGNGLHLEDVDFDITIYNDGIIRKERKYVKAQLIEVDMDSYVVVVDTSRIGIGHYWCRLAVHLPDADCHDGFRDEVVCMPTGINVTR